MRTSICAMSNTVLYLVEQARNLSKQQNMPLSIGHYLNNMSKLTNQWTRSNYKESERQRIYLKDIDCPQIWHDKLKEQVPPSIFYLNESTGDIGGPGSLNEPNLPGSGHMQGQGVARAGDLMSCIPPVMRAENMMCYIGHEGTYTPAHREMCASLGQNLMVETSGIVDDDGKAAKPGSSIWFMTETNDRHLVSEYWLSTLGHDIEVESHFAQINAWKAAPFKTYIVEQRAGDFILIPPLAPHQVWNRGTRTMKVAWNRTTVETLEMALHEALPRARIVCRDEQYKNKAIIYFALDKYSSLLRQVDVQKHTATNPQDQVDLTYGTKIRQLQKDFRRLFSLYTEILLSEMLSPVSPGEKRGQYLPYDSFVTCSYCRCNIFNRFLTCPSCIAPLEGGEEDTYDICMECYAMGRSCACLSKYKWVEQFPWQDLVQKHELWRHQVIDFDGGVSEKSPQPLNTVRNNMGKKTLAQVCQEQLKARPWNDPKNPAPAMSSWERHHPWEVAAEQEEIEVNVDDQGNVKKSKSRKSRADRLPKGYLIEHVSHYPELRWKLASCTKCDSQYSYGSLFRMFDLMPLTVMENPEWECPHCLKICSAGNCRNKPGMKPYEPNGTVLGVDTKKVADPRSVESLVNFGIPNITWIKKAGDDHPHENRRLSRRADEAARAKAKDPTLGEHYVDEEEDSSGNNQDSDAGIQYSAGPDIPVDPMLIDPMLSMDQPTVQTNGKAKEKDGESEYVESPGEAPIESRVWKSVTSFLAGRETTPPPSSRLFRKENQHGHHNPANENHTPEFEASIHGPGYSQRAPLANMIDQNAQGKNFTSNGIAYEYPDPTESQSTPSFPATNHYAQPNTIDRNRKRSTTNILQSDAALPRQNDSNEQHRQALTEGTLEEAKGKDRYISAEAAISGKRLRITLSVDKAKLAALISSVPNRAIPAFRKEPPILLQSDLPSLSHAEKPNEPHKKRRVKKDDDEDFTARKRADRRSSTARSTLAKDLRKKTTKYTEVSSDSDVDMQEDMPTAFIPVNKSQGPRPLPKYLARRSEGDQLSTLAERGRRKSVQPPGQIPAPTAAMTPARENHNHNASASTQFPISTTLPRNPSKTPIDSFAAEPLPEPDPDTHLSLLGPGATTISTEPNKEVAKDKRNGLATSLINPQEKLAEDNQDGETRAPIDSAKKQTGDVRNGPTTTLNDNGKERAATKRLAATTTPDVPANKIVEENRKAKLKAMHWASDDEDDKSPSSESSSSDVEPIPATKHNGKLMALPKSMFSRPGMAGKKVKVIAAKPAATSDEGTPKRGRGRPKKSLDAT